MWGFVGGIFWRGMGTRGALTRITAVVLVGVVEVEARASHPICRVSICAEARDTALITMGRTWSGSVSEGSGDQGEGMSSRRKTQRRPVQEVHCGFRLAVVQPQGCTDDESNDGTCRRRRARDDENEHTGEVVRAPSSYKNLSPRSAERARDLLSEGASTQRSR